MLYDYQREEFRVQAELADQSARSQCPLIEDEVTLAVYNHTLELEDFVRMIATDWVESSADKIKVQRDDYMRKAKWLLDRLDVPRFG